MFANYIPPMTSDVMMVIAVAITFVTGAMGYMSNSILRDNAFGTIGNGLLLLFGSISGFVIRLVLENFLK